MTKHKPRPTTTTSTTTTTEPPPTTEDTTTTSEPSQETTTSEPVATTDPTEPDPTVTEPSIVDSTFAGGPVCEQGWFPASYAADSECVPFDPCSPDGITTLWTVQPCPTSGVSSTSSEVGMPMLPATGAEATIAGAGVGFLLAGVIAVCIARRTVRS